MEQKGEKPNLDVAVTISERVHNHILETPKRRKLLINDYLEEIYNSNGIKPNEKNIWPDIGRDNQYLMESVFRSLKEDWENTADFEIKSSIKGQLVEWLVLKSLLERYGRIKPAVFDVYKSSDPAVDKKFYTDLFIKAPIPESGGIRQHEFGIDITISRGGHEKKLRDYQEHAKGLGYIQRFKAFPIFVDMKDIELEKMLEYQEERKRFAEKFYTEMFLPQVQGEELLNFSQGVISKMTKYIKKY